MTALFYQQTEQIATALRRTDDQTMAFYNRTNSLSLRLAQKFSVNDRYFRIGAWTTVLDRLLMGLLIRFGQLDRSTALRLRSLVQYRHC